MNTKPMRNGMHPPSRWVCPKCGATVKTHVPTAKPECRSAKHRNQLAYMEVAE